MIPLLNARSFKMTTYYNDRAEPYDPEKAIPINHVGPAHTDNALDYKEPTGSSPSREDSYSAQEKGTAIDEGQITQKGALFRWSQVRLSGYFNPAKRVLLTRGTRNRNCLAWVSKHEVSNGFQSRKDRKSLFHRASICGEFG